MFPNNLFNIVENSLNNNEVWKNLDEKARESILQSIKVPLEDIAKQINFIIYGIEKDCEEAEKIYGSCWYKKEPDLENEEELEFCSHCHGFLYIERGGDIIDCPYCGGTGIEYPEPEFDSQKFGEWIMEEPFFLDILFHLQILKSIGVEDENENLPNLDEKILQAKLDENQEWLEYLLSKKPIKILRL